MDRDSSGMPGSKYAALALAAVVLSGAAVLTAFGWYAALGLVIPLLIALVWVGIFTAAAWGAGNLAIARWLSALDPGLERIVLQLLAGAAVLTAATGLLGAVHVLEPPVVLVVLAGFGCHGALHLYRQPLRFTTEVAWADLGILLVIGVAGGLSFAASTTFAPFYDQWHYHLGFPYQWLRMGSIATFPRHAYSFFPSNMGLLYLYALAGPGGWAAQTLHWWMGALTAAGSAVIARRLGAPPGGQALAAAVFAATPSVVQVGALAASDLGVAAYTAGAVIALLNLRSLPQQATRWATISGAFAGLAAGCKYLALATVVPPVAIGAAAVSWPTSRAGSLRLRELARVMLVFGAAVAVTAGPWLLRNTVRTGNPVHPYFASVFAVSGGAGSRIESRAASGIGDFAVSTDSLTTAVTLGTFSRRGHAADIGPVYLWLTPLIVIWMWRRRRDPGARVIFTVFVLGVVAWSTGPPLGRYLLPSLALAGALAGAAWFDLTSGLARPLRHALTWLLLLVLLANCNPVRGEYLGRQLACFLGSQTDEAYLRENCTQLVAIRTANAELSPEATVYLLGEPRPFGVDRNVVVEDAFRTPLLVELAQAARSPAEIAVHLRRMGITHILWNGAEAARIASTSGRDEYLACATPEARARLESFLSDTVTVVRAGPWWTIVAVPEN